MARKNWHNWNSALLASLPGRLEALNASLNADYISLENLPAELKQLWLSADGRQRIEIYPKQDMQDNAALRQFVREIQSITPQVTGSPVNNLEASDAVAAAFKQAFLYAFIAITLMLYVLLTRKRDVFLVLIPLLMAAALTGGISVLAGLPLNFANVIALPLLLGIGVDSGIHIIHRFRTDLPDGKSILATSSARAVVVKLPDHHGRRRQPCAVPARRHRQHGNVADPGHRRHPGLYADRPARPAYCCHQVAITASAVMPDSTRHPV